jgi:glutamine---fructose-6-phosphate transaminase (isomerizing)
MTGLSNDIVNEAPRLLRSLDYSFGAGKPDIEAAAALLRKTAHIYIVGIGSSWHAGMAMECMFRMLGVPALLVDASEMVHFGETSHDASVIFLSRSGKSLEILQLVEKCHSANANVIAITNTPDSALAKQAHVVLACMTDFDHLISISMYSALAMIGGLLAEETVTHCGPELHAALARALEHAVNQVGEWSNAVESSDWLEPEEPTYFLARGTSLASAYEARLLWEEAAKAPATVVTTGGFRHGPQEVVRENLRVCLWVSDERMRSQDMTLLHQMRAQGAKVMAIGRDIEAGTADLSFHIPATPFPWQFLVDIFPAQIVAELLARLRGEDCDAFRFCSYVVESEGGLTTAKEPNLEHSRKSL